MLSLISKILALASELLGFRLSLLSAEYTRRLRASVLFANIAGCIERVAIDLAEVRIPHGACRELHTYALEIPERVATELGAAKAEELGAMLEDAHNVEMLLATLKNSPDPEGEIVKLWAAVGQLRALANLLKV
jgi:hypothetical protein